MLTPQVVEKPELLVVGLEAPFVSALSPEATNLPVIGRLWEQFLHRVGQVPNRLGGEMYGIVFERPGADRRHPHGMEYLASVRVSATAEVPTGMAAHTVPAGTFAVFTDWGPIEAIGRTLAEIYREWLPRSLFRHAGTADVELYDHRFRMGRDDSEMEYWVPVVPKAEPS
jgi:AraC family transcriptional regulator